MLVSSGGDASVQRATGPVAQQRRRPGVAMRCGILASLLVAYQGSFTALYALVGSPAFLLGLCICILGALWLGLGGALIVIVSVVIIDRGHALHFAATP